MKTIIYLFILKYIKTGPFISSHQNKKMKKEKGKNPPKT